MIKKGVPRILIMWPVVSLLVWSLRAMTNADIFLCLVSVFLIGLLSILLSAP